MFSFSTENFSCPYCGKSFPELSLLREHEKLEAIEFEREVQKLKTNGANSSNESYVVLEDSTEDSMMDVYDDEDYEDYEEGGRGSSKRRKGGGNPNLNPSST